MTAPVAFVIPNLNCGRYLRQCLDSIAAQTWQPAEVVVVDGGSSDDSQEVWREWATTGAPNYEMAWIYDYHPGIAVARNRGVRETTAPWIVQLDADDWIQPQYVERCWSISETCVHCAAGSDHDTEDYCPPGIIAPGLRHIGLPPGCSWERLEADYTQMPDSPVTLPKILDHNCIFGASMYRRECWEQVGGYDEHSRHWEDWAFFASIVEKGWKVAVVNEPLINYRHHPDSSTRRMQPSDHAEYTAYVRGKFAKGAK